MSNAATGTRPMDLEAIPLTMTALLKETGPGGILAEVPVPEIDEQRVSPRRGSLDMRHRPTHLLVGRAGGQSNEDSDRVWT